MARSKISLRSRSTFSSLVSFSVRDADAAAELLDDMGREVQRAVEGIAQLAQLIYPPFLETGGLPAALRAAAVTLGVRTEIIVTVPQLPPATAGAV